MRLNEVQRAPKLIIAILMLVDFQHLVFIYVRFQQHYMVDRTLAQVC